MNPSEYLHQLIKALSPNEKRYFKVFASRHVIGEQNNYIRLFDAIDAQEKYNEELIREQFAGENFIKHLPSEKRYLQKLILKAMRLFHAATGIDEELRANIDEAWFLYKRGLYDLCEKLVKKTEEAAIKHEKHAILIGLYDLKRYLVQKVSDNSRLQLLEKTREKYRLTAQMLERDYLLVEMKYKLFELMTNYHALDLQERKNKLQQLETQFTELGEDGADTFEMVMNQWQCKVYLAQIKKDYNSVKQAYAHIVTLWESIERGEVENNRYKKSLVNLLYSCHQVSDYNDFEILLEKAESISSTNSAEEAKTFQSLGILRILYCLNTAQWDKGLDAARKILEKLPRHEKAMRVSQLLALRYNLSVLYFFTGRFGELLDQTVAIYNVGEEKNTRTDIRDFARIMGCIAHFELGNKDIIDSQTRSVYRYLSKKNRLHEYERILINHIKQLPSAYNIKTSREFFSRLASDLSALTIDIQAVGYKEVDLWANSRFSGIPMKELHAQRLVSRQVQH